MRSQPAPECEHAQGNRYSQTDFMNQGIDEQATYRRDQGDNEKAQHTMNKAKPGKDDRETIDPFSTRVELTVLHGA